MKKTQSFQFNKTQNYPIAILSIGFRPFFLLGILFAIFSMLILTLIYPQPLWQLPNQNYPILFWHAHEMIFGFSLAICVGFLLTMLKNVTSISTIQGLPLMLLVLLWLLARGLIFVNHKNILLIICFFDLLFGALASLAMLLPIIIAKQHKQYSLVGKIILLIFANAVFYWGLIYNSQILTKISLYAGFYLVLALVLTMGRRVIPSFIEHGLKMTQCPFSAINRSWIDRSNLILFLLFNICELVFIVNNQLYINYLSAFLALCLCALHSIRLYDWYHKNIWKQPLLWALYVAYLWIVIGFALIALRPFILISTTLALHAFAIGGIALMCAGMIARVSLGHSGRNIFFSSKLLIPAFILLNLVVIVRVFAVWLLPEFYNFEIYLTIFLWVLSFALLAYIYLPILITNEKVFEKK